MFAVYNIYSNKVLHLATTKDLAFAFLREMCEYYGGRFFGNNIFGGSEYICNNNFYGVKIAK